MQVYGRNCVQRCCIILYQNILCCCLFFKLRHFRANPFVFFGERLLYRKKPRFGTAKSKVNTGLCICRESEVNYIIVSKIT